MKVGPALFVVLVFLPLCFLFSQSSTPITIQAERATQSIAVDGFLEEQAWKRPGFSTFMQRDPNQGEAATEKTPSTPGRSRRSRRDRSETPAP